jgi:hypothetical protein
MNIRTLQSAAQPISTRKAGSATDANAPAPASDAPRPEAAANNPVAGDRVELSTAARAQDADAQSAELAEAKKAYGGLPPLSPERRETILQRVQEGYYSQPDIIGIIAERLDADLTGRKPEM